MKKSDVQIGVTYLVKVAGNLVPVKITREHDNGGWEGTSVKTGKTIRIKSPQRLRKRHADTGGASERAMAHTATDKPKRRMGLLDAAAEVLTDADEPLTTKEMVALVTGRRLWTPGDGKTPAATLYSAIHREIKNKGDESRFEKAERGKFRMRKGA